MKAVECGGIKQEVIASMLSCEHSLWCQNKEGTRNTASVVIAWRCLVMSFMFLFRMIGSPINRTYRYSILHY